MGDWQSCGGKSLRGGCKVKDLHCACVMGFQMEEDKIIELLNVYMPCNGRDNLEEFEHTLAQLNSTIKTSNATLE